MFVDEVVLAGCNDSDWIDSHRQVLVEQEISGDTGEDKLVTLTVSRDQPPAEPFIITDTNSPSTGEFVTGDAILAVQCFLQRCEHYHAPEGNVLRRIAASTEINGDSLVATLSNTSRTERVDRVTDLLDVYTGTPFDADGKLTYFSEAGSTRGIDTTNDIVTTVRDIVSDVVFNTQNPYYNAYTTVEALLSADVFSVVVYCEGFAVPKYGGVPMLHAWVEIEGSVIEVSWPWTGISPSELSVYYGEAYDWNVVAEAMSEIGEYRSVTNTVL